MIYEEWHMRLYCDSRGCDEQGEFFGHNISEAQRAARTDGWIVQRNYRHAKCPKCAEDRSVNPKKLVFIK